MHSAGSDGVTAAAVKAELRSRMRAVRDSLDDDHARSERLWKQVTALPEYRNARVVMAFRSIRSEPDTTPLVVRCRAAGKQLVFPRVEGGQLVAVPVALRAGRSGGAENTFSTTFVTSSFGVPEPEGPSIDPATIDLVITPGLAFSADGRRLGYGRGFYDRFLPLLRPDATAVGVCFAEQVVADLPADDNDVAVDLVVTDRGLVPYS